MISYRALRGDYTECNEVIMDEAKKETKKKKPWGELKAKDPKKWDEMIRVAAKSRLGGNSWRNVAQESGISINTLFSWDRNPETRVGKRWKSAMQAEAVAAGTDLSGHRLDIDLPGVTSEGFETPKELCNHWAVEAARVQIEMMIDPKVAKKDRLEASKRVQDIGGHSPVNKSMVLTAPLNDPGTAQLLLAVLQEIRQIEAELVSEEENQEQSALVSFDVPQVEYGS